MTFTIPNKGGYVDLSEQPAGFAAHEFTPVPEEPARHLLREIYYRQRLFHRCTGCYTDHLCSLQIIHRLLRDFLSPPRIESTGNMYEA